MMAKSDDVYDSPAGSSTTTLKMMDSLQDDLDLQMMAFMDMTSKEVNDVYAQKIQELAATEIVENAIQIGDRMPGFKGKDEKHRIVRSSELLAKGPLIISFFRGDWCPYCNIELERLSKVHSDILARGATLIAISPQSHDKMKQHQKETGVLQKFPIVCDETMSIAKKFRIAFELDPILNTMYLGWGIDLASANADGSTMLPLAATYVIDQSGTVVYSFMHCAPSQRAEPVDILNAIPHNPKAKTRQRFTLRSRLQKLLPNISRTSRAS